MARRPWPRRSDEEVYVQWWQAVVLGLVEGITEYFPVSSTGHLILAADLMRMGQTEEQRAALDAFHIVIQGGPILAVLGLYWVYVKRMILGVFGRDAGGMRLLINILIAFIPTAVVGVLLSDRIEARLFHPTPVLAALFVGGVYMIWVDRWRLKREQMARLEARSSGEGGGEGSGRAGSGVGSGPGSSSGIASESEISDLRSQTSEADLGSGGDQSSDAGRRSGAEQGSGGDKSTGTGGDGKDAVDAFSELTPAKALAIGLLQCVSVLWPGTSRAMMTITGGVLVGMRPGRAAEFSFLLGLPTLTGACAYRLAKDLHAAHTGEAPNMFQALGVAPVLLGLAVATVSAAAAVKWMVGFLNHRGLTFFGIYRILLCVVMAGLVIGGFVRIGAA
jgi:undecaprenyl pyrophosphate phosphatase UppP